MSELTDLLNRYSLEDLKEALNHVEKTKNIPEEIKKLEDSTNTNLKPLKLNKFIDNLSTKNFCKYSIELANKIQTIFNFADDYNETSFCLDLAKDIIKNLDNFTVETYVAIIVSFYLKNYGFEEKPMLDNVLKKYAKSINAKKLVFKYRKHFYKIFINTENHCIDYIEPEDLDIPGDSNFWGSYTDYLKNKTKVVTFLPNIYSQACLIEAVYDKINEITIDSVHVQSLGVDALRSAVYGEYNFTYTKDYCIYELVEKYPIILVEKYAKLAIAKTFSRAASFLNDYKINIYYDSLLVKHKDLLKNKAFIFRYDNTWYQAKAINNKLVFEITPVKIALANQEDQLNPDDENYDYNTADINNFITWYPSIFNLCDKNDNMYDLAVSLYACEYWWWHF